MDLTPIQKFYSGKTIFVTGGTGFLGKCLIEKFLRSCPDIKKIIILIRSKRNQSYNVRKGQYFDDLIFDLVKSDNPSVIQKVHFVNGDITKPNLGIDDENYEMLIKSVNVIFHVAATVNFEAPLKVAVPVHILAAKYIVKIAKETTNLEALIHTSSSYTHLIMDFADENIHQGLSYSPEFFINLIKSVNNETLIKITPDLLGNWPNTYVLTKHAAECYVKEEKGTLPIAICRPGAIISTYREPIPGWTNNYNTVMGLAIGIGLGILKFVRIKPSLSLQLIPVDMVANCMIAIGWNISKEKNNELKIYNCTSEVNRLLIKKLFDYSASAKFALESAVWYPGYISTSVPLWLYKICIGILIGIPAGIGDIILQLFCQKTKFKLMYRHYSTLINVLSYFLSRPFIFKHNNMAFLWKKLEPNDKKLFNFDVNSINWDNYLDSFHAGLKTILLKENVNNIKKAQTKRKLLFFLHYLLLLLFFICIVITYIKIIF